MKQEIESWLVDWFNKRNGKMNSKICPEESYYQKGYIDSFGIIELIGDIEDHFAIRFDDKDFQDPAFRTVMGLVNIIDQKQNDG